MRIRGKKCVDTSSRGGRYRDRNSSCEAPMGQPVSVQLTASLEVKIDAGSLQIMDKADKASPLHRTSTSFGKLFVSCDTQ